jgi:flagellar hook assembly protein FlgD
MYHIPKRDAAIVKKIFDAALGRKIRILDSGIKDSGYHTVSWDGKDSFGKQVSAGIYLYQLQIGQYIQTNKMVLIK